MGVWGTEQTVHQLDLMDWSNNQKPGKSPGSNEQRCHKLAFSRRGRTADTTGRKTKRENQIRVLARLLNISPSPNATDGSIWAGILVLDEKSITAASQV